MVSGGCGSESRHELCTPEFYLRGACRWRCFRAVASLIYLRSAGALASPAGPWGVAFDGGRQVLFEGVEFFAKFLSDSGLLGQLVLGFGFVLADVE